MRPPRSAVNAADVAEVEAQEAEAFASAEVDDAALLIIDFDLEFVELLAEAFLHRANQPVMSLVGVDQDHQIVSESRIFEKVYLPLLVLALARSSIRSTSLR